MPKHENTKLLLFTLDGAHGTNVATSTGEFGLSSTEVREAPSPIPDLVACSRIEVRRRWSARDECMLRGAVHLNYSIISG